MAGIAAIAMSQTKEDLLKHLNLPPATYALMAKETDVVYHWLISHKSHLKENGKRKAPFDWSDIQERAKDDAMAIIARGGNQYTEYYWNLGAGSGNNPNWVAKWFLYHKFRYRDGRNRSQKSGEKHHDKHSGSKPKRSSREQPLEKNYDYQERTIAGSRSHGYSVSYSSTSANQYDAMHYDSSQYDYDAQGSSGHNGGQSGTFHDPVRDVTI
ncbi:hypothetical protein WAI453_009797 [Rhynchosporium graminicola]|uniref:Uncharacterized protein n=1 Tax=Rhynchosporium graminicola TaxID=2792576 RepID=A0A1E1KDR4_9HELO|nr:uncharacterized protein RCO7_05014 [Rhynchosporium commune]